MIRHFRVDDIDQIVEILKLNYQYGHPEVDGPEAMKRVSECKMAIFLVFETDDKVVGIIRGNYDGSRAIIHQLSVHPQYQRQGIGTALVNEVVRMFRERDAPTVSATVIEESLLFWQKNGFRRTKAFIVGNW
ncbi:MAG: GNAT family N-acetyltransferase [Candidatus Bathyarchaeota archaeon]|jgi:ribosomal protein S18 acetylase RimI-like enzyme